MEEAEESRWAPDAEHDRRGPGAYVQYKHRTQRAWEWFCASAPHGTPGQGTPRVRPRETPGRGCCWSTLHPHFQPAETAVIKGCYFKLLSLWQVKVAIKTKVHFKAAIKMF